MRQLYYELPQLTEAEKALPVYKYYRDYPLHTVGPLFNQILKMGAMDKKEALTLDRWQELFREEGYDDIEYGYCMLDDRTGYIANYSVLPGEVTPQMRMWYVKWMNIHSKNLPVNCGNIRYKLWNQVDHIDHGLVDGDFKKGIYTLETLDMGAGEKPIRSVRHNFDIRDYGFSEEKYEKLTKLGIGITSCWESFECPGSHLVLSITRKCPLGGTETCSREWIGWKAENGKFIRDDETPDFMLNENYLRNVQIHNTVEQQHMATFLPALYREYSELEMDAD